jgi:ABC-type multidrug transport system fused ATPase/permease subunit
MSNTTQAPRKISIVLPFIVTVAIMLLNVFIPMLLAPTASMVVMGIIAFPLTSFAWVAGMWLIIAIGIRISTYAGTRVIESPQTRKVLKSAQSLHKNLTRR